MYSMSGDGSVHLIGLDVGTSAIKGVMTDGGGRVLAEAGAQTALLYPQDGYVEIDASQLYEGVCGVIRVLAAAGAGTVKALAMAGAWGNVLLSDKAGRPLMNIISWMDRRAEQYPPAALAGIKAGELAQITGWPCISSFPLAQLAWLRQHRAELYGSAGHMGMDSDWLMHCLSGQWVLDHSTATTSHLQAQTRGAYHEPFLKMLDIPREKLAELRPWGTAVGPLTAAAAEATGLAATTTVVTGCFDHPAAALAVGVVAPGQLLLSCGTSWVGFVPCRERQRIIDAGMLCDTFLSGNGGPWGGILSVPYIGRNIDWYIDNVIAPKERDRLGIFNEAAAEARPGAEGLKIDLRQPPQAMAGSRKNISRAVMEGAAGLLHEKIRQLQEQGMGSGRAVMVGGPAQSPVWPGIVAEITGLEVSNGGKSAGARGAALLAGMGVGILPRALANAGGDA